MAIKGASWESQQLGHGILTAEKHYVGLIRHIQQRDTLEAAMGVEPELQAIIAAVSVV